MKAEERHELKENDLQSWMQYGFPVWIKNNGSYLLLAAALLLLGWQLWGYYEKKQLVLAQTAWNELAATEAPGVENRAIKLQALIDQYDIKPIRALALRALGNSYLESVAAGASDEANNAVALDKQDSLNRAQAAFDRIIKEYPDQQLALGSAKIGLAVIAEDRGEWDSAKKQYEAIIDKSSPFAATAFAQEASIRLAQLDKIKDAPRLAAMPVTLPATRPMGPELPSRLPPGGSFSPSVESTTAASRPAPAPPAATLPR